MAILKNRKQEMYDRIEDNLIIEFTVGGDRFDSKDINYFIEVEGMNREVIYNRLKERQRKIDEDSTRDLGHSILPEDFFRKMVGFWLFKEFDDSLTAICKDNKYNFIKKDGDLLSDDMWFDSVSSPHNGLIKVSKDNKFNFLKSDGSLVSSDWFDNTLHFYEDHAVVEKDGRCWFIDRNNHSLTGGQTFNNAESFFNGMAIVTGDDGMKSYVNSKGEVRGSAKELTAFRGNCAFASWCSDSWYLIDKDFNVKNALSIQRPLLTSVPQLHLVGKSIDGQMLFNILHDSGKFVLPGWVKTLKENNQGSQEAFMRISTSFRIDGQHDFTVKSDGSCTFSSELQDHLKGCQKLKSGEKQEMKLRR